MPVLGKEGVQNRSGSDESQPEFTNSQKSVSQKKIKIFTYGCINKLIESEMERTRNDSRRWNGMECIKSLQRGLKGLREIFESKFRRRGSHENEVCKDENISSSLYVGKLAEHVNEKFCKLQIKIQNEEMMLGLKEMDSW